MFRLGFRCGERIDFWFSVLMLVICWLMWVWGDEIVDCGCVSVSLLSLSLTDCVWLLVVYFALCGFVNSVGFSFSCFVIVGLCFMIVVCLDCCVLFALVFVALFCFGCGLEFCCLLGLFVDCVCYVAWLVVASRL